MVKAHAGRRDRGPGAPPLRAGGKVILTAIKARVPRRTGNLSKAIKLRASRRSRKQPKNPKPGAREGWHPAHVELGYVRKTKNGTFHIPPRSFIRAGFDAVKEQALQAIEAEVGRRMELIYGKPKAAASLDEGGD